jgi:hypothetical protein
MLKNVGRPVLILIKINALIIHIFVNFNRKERFRYIDKGLIDNGKASY